MRENRRLPSMRASAPRSKDLRLSSGQALLRVDVSGTLRWRSARNNGARK
jgi:hypothetical protein